MNVEVPWLLPALYWIIGVAFGYVFQSMLTRLQLKEAERNARMILEDARRERESRLREADIEARNTVLKAREEFEREVRERRQELDVTAKELVARSDELHREREVLDAQVSEYRALTQQVRSQWEKCAGLTSDQARAELLNGLREELAAETASLVIRSQEEARRTADDQARRLLAIAMERYAADSVTSVTSSVIRLPNEEMKARIIGKEGRNIRALEAATGVNVVIDETPETVTLSSFDPVRREIARRSIEALVQDGRIHPGRIEEAVAQAQASVEDAVREAGRSAVHELGLNDVAPEVEQAVGRLAFRQSYGQNVLKHSIEMARLLGLLAAEMQLDQSLARRIGLFHDIGKGMDHRRDGSHALVGAELLRQNGEDPIVCNAVAAHHQEVESQSVYAVLTRVADTLTAARPGARAESSDLYYKRLENLETVAKSFPGVDRCFAIQAGRELRVIVEPAMVSDEGAVSLARAICKRIAEDVKPPGPIKVTVVRETRVTEYVH